MLTSAKQVVTCMTTDAIYEERGSDWSHQVSAVDTTRWLQHNQTLPLSAKGVACETSNIPGIQHSSVQYLLRIQKFGAMTNQSCLSKFAISE